MAEFLIEMDLSKFDDIRPYFDSEVHPAVERIAASPFIKDIAGFLKITDKEELRKILLSCNSVDDFQDRIMATVVSLILKNTADKVVFNGLHYFDANRTHVIITNHRDIVLDSAIIQLILHNNKIKTTEMAVGDNLISSQFIEDIARSNKMIKVIRTTSPREVYTTSKILSEYIRYKVAGQRSSIWIAQRNGRTKDGVDLTEQGLLKMLDMSGSGDFVKDMEELDILPVAISYEYEPCDVFKTHELYVSRRQKYIKGEDEDYNSILTGLTQWKGNIHLEFTEPVLPKEVEYCAQFTKNERFQELAKIIDKQIHHSYKLWPNNYISADLLAEEAVGSPADASVSGDQIKDKYSAHYTLEQKSHFEEYAAKQLSTLEGDAAELREIFLGIYANPVISQEQ